MIKEFVEKWDKYKKDLEEYFRTNKQSEYDEYSKIVKALFEKVINTENTKFDLDNMTVINDGDYQGTLTFIIPKYTYQPNVKEYVMTNTYYGSCSGCDTLQAIIDYKGLPSEQQVKDYMELALHLLQKCKWLEE